MANSIEDLFGQYFCSLLTGGEPTVVRVVGWTRHSLKPEAKRRTLYVEPVALKTQYHCGGGGQAYIDQAWCQKHRRLNPVTKNRRRIYINVLD